MLLQCSLKNSICCLKNRNRKEDLSLTLLGFSLENSIYFLKDSKEDLSFTLLRFSLENSICCLKDKNSKENLSFMPLQCSLKNSICCLKNMKSKEQQCTLVFVFVRLLHSLFPLSANTAPMAASLPSILVFCVR
jgi:hypothetical protein